MDKEKIIKELKRQQSLCLRDNEWWYEVLRIAIEALSERATGYWILRDDINGKYQCQKCGMFTGFDKFDVKEEGFKLPKYCSNCGRRNVIQE